MGFSQQTPFSKENLAIPTMMTRLSSRKIRKVMLRKRRERSEGSGLVCSLNNSIHGIHYHT